jgi:hypothetical protein
MSNELSKTHQNNALAQASEINELFGIDAIQMPLNAPLPIAKIVREKPVFELPDGSLVKELIGNILFYTNANVFYAAKYGEGESVLPDCFSSNGIAPDGGEHKLPGPCAACPNNKFGSNEDGTGKACANTLRMYILLQGDILPTLLSAPPSSMGKKDSLIKWLISAPNTAAKACGSPAYQLIRVKLSLVTKRFESGFDASILQLETLNVLDMKVPEQMAEIKRLGSLTKQFKALYVNRIAQDMASETQAPQSAKPDDGGLPTEMPDCPV